MIKPYFEDAKAGIVIYHGDCREILPGLGHFDLCLTDPPYGIGYQHDGSGRGKHSRRNSQAIIGDSGPFDPAPLLAFPNVILWGADHYANRLPEGRWLVWDKLDGLESFDSFSDVEIAWQNRKGASRIFRYLWKGICQAGEKEGGRPPPSLKPACLMGWCLTFVPEAKLVLDPYCGTGPVLEACKARGIAAVGIEIEERYAEIAARRLQQEVLPLA